MLHRLEHAGERRQASARIRLTAFYEQVGWQPATTAVKSSRNHSSHSNDKLVPLKIDRTGTESQQLRSHDAVRSTEECQGRIFSLPHNVTPYVACNTTSAFLHLRFCILRRIGVCTS